MKRHGTRLHIIRWLIRTSPNAAGFLAVPDARWPTGQAGLQQRYDLFTEMTNGGWYGHCQQVDLMIQMPTLTMLDRAARLGICTLIQVGDHFAGSIDLVTHRTDVNRG